MAEPSPDAAVALLLDDFVHTRNRAGPVRAARTLRRALESANPPLWLNCAQELRRRHEFDAALALLEPALARAPDSIELRYEKGEALRLAGEPERAEIVLRALLQLQFHAPATIALAEALRAQGKLEAAAATVAEWLEQQPADVETALSRITFVDQCQRQPLAARLCRDAIARGLDDPRLFALAGRVASTLGDFTTARQHYLAALNSGSAAGHAFTLQALAACQRYDSAAHPDFARFDAALRNVDLPPYAHAAVLFALGKAQDDLRDHAAAANTFRQANALVRGILAWRLDTWNDQLRARLTLPVPAATAEIDLDFIPVFIVGLPRSGTTLVADRLGRHPSVRNRGELNLVPFLDKWAARETRPPGAELLRRLASFAAAQLRQDDAPAGWYIDKNPLNFRYLDLIASLFPQARIIYCVRDLRDTALSIWQQFFARGGDNGYAYAFGDIAGIAAGCERLMRHWQRCLRLPIHILQYERLVRQPQETLQELSGFLELPNVDLLAAETPAGSTIGSSSAWQARQAIYTRSIGRWRAYAAYVPELSDSFPESASGG